MVRIRAAQTTFRDEEYFEGLEHVQQALTIARTSPGHAMCLCVSPARPLVIRQIGTQLYLAVWPNDGARHHPSCPFHRDEDAAGALADGSSPERSQRAQSATPISSLPLSKDGNWIIHLDLPRPAEIKQSDHPKSPTSTPHSTENPSSTPPSSQRLKLQHLWDWLWDAAPLNRHDPRAPIHWPKVRHWLMQSLSAVVCDGMPMDRTCFVPLPFSRERATELNALWDRFLIDLGGAPTRRGYVIAEIIGIFQTEYGYRVSLKHTPTPVFINDALFHDLTRRYPLIMGTLSSETRKASIRVLSLLAVEVTRKGNLRGIDMGLLMTSSSYIRCHSIVEARVAAVLEQAHRLYDKGAGGPAADFVLRDTEPPVCMIVTTLGTPAQLRRQEQLRFEMKQSGRQVWVWNASGGSDMPPLPAAVQVAT